MLTPSTTKQNPPGFCFFKGIPVEIFDEIISYLTVIELARIQRTCRGWHAEIQKSSKLWTRSGPFFEHFRGKGVDENFYQGFKALCKLSENKLDEIGLHHKVNKVEIDNDALLQWRIKEFLKAIPKLNPTSLKFTCWLTEEYHSHLPILLSLCRNLRELTIDFDEKLLKGRGKVNIHPKKKPINLDSLSLNEYTLELWKRKEASRRTSSSIKTFSLRMLNTDETNIYDIFDFFRHFRRSIESITIFDIKSEILSTEHLMYLDESNEEKRIIFPNLIQANCTLCDDDDYIWFYDPSSSPRYRFYCPNIRELSIGHTFFWRVFYWSAESLKKLNLTSEVSEVGDLEDILHLFPCVESVQIKLKERILRSLVKKVPNQLKYLQVSVDALNEYYATSLLTEI